MLALVRVRVVEILDLAGCGELAGAIADCTRQLGNCIGILACAVSVDVAHLVHVIAIDATVVLRHRIGLGEHVIERTLRLVDTPLNIYGQPRVMKAIRNDYSYAFGPDQYPGVPQLVLNPLQPEPFEVKGVEVIPVKVRHMTLPIFGYRIRNFGYITDASFISETEKKKLRGVKVLVINALRREQHYSHFNLEQALAIIDEIKPERAYLTHVSHRLGKYVDVSQELPQNVFLGIDNQLIEV